MLGAEESNWLSDLSDLAGALLHEQSDIYTKVILKLIRTGSRWREARAGDLRPKQTAGTVTTYFRK